MKIGLVTSTALHVVVLGFGLVSLQAPRAFEAADVESLPVDIVPIEEITQIQDGDKKAPMTETPAPLPTERPDIVPDARKVGENDVDTEAAPVPDTKPKPVETAALPEPSPEPAPDPTPEPEVEQPQANEPEPVPATEVEPQPQPRQEVTPDPTPEAAEPEEAEAENAHLPQTAPAPQARPEPPKAQTAKAPDRKTSEKPATKQAQKPESDEKEFDADEVAALLNKQTPSGGGAKRSTQEASLGGRNPTGGEKLSQSEMDALRQRLGSCWNVPAGVDDADALKVSVRFRLDRSGNLEGRPEVIKGGASSGPRRIAAESAVRAVQKCEPFNLPSDKYQTWAEVVVNFDPSDMF
ncbi:hypothetical protein [Mesorhizobium xinjiangense]|uniref:hypothetical protein n=1 Tax=Mesorhizobium xinjiangense TaxID=2678685 RepID=UPI0012EE3625|nr:hypothetical protein [Mesorhizobium xinjiangense]